MTAPDRPVLPVHRVFYRWVPRLERFVPCPDRTGTLIANVDAEGRSVIAVCGNPFDVRGREVAGYKLDCSSSMTDPAEVKEWLDAEVRCRLQP